MSAQLVLPLASKASMSRADFLSAPCNEEALAFIDSWPDWPVPAAALYGPPGSGKTHLVSAWAERSGADIVSADAPKNIDRSKPVVIENIDSSKAGHARDALLFALIEGAERTRPVLLTGHEPPRAWATTLPDLASRFSAMLAFPLWAPDEGLLAALARKLFTDRQLNVPEPVIARMLTHLERSPGAVRDFVARVDAKALAEKRPVTIALIQEIFA